MIAAIISGVIALGVGITELVVTNKAGQKSEIIQIMQEYVAEYGISYDEVKSMFPKLYKKNKDFFKEQYNLAYLEYEKSAKTQITNVGVNLKDNLQPILIFIIIALFTYYITQKF
jgi:negative regulator of sigma E activity